VAAARALDPDGGPLPRLGAALAAGRVSREHVEVAVRTLNRIPSGFLTRVGGDDVAGAERVDVVLTEHACRFAPFTADLLGRRILDLLDPRRGDRFDPDGYRRRDLAVVTDATGMVIVRGQLDPVGGAAFKAALDRYIARHPTTAEAAAPAAQNGHDGHDERNGRDGRGEQGVLVADLRTSGQRRADALVALARAAAGATGTSLPPPATVLVSVPVQTDPDGQVRLARTGHATHLGPLAGNRLDRLTCDANLRRVLVTPEGGILNVGRTQRLATPTQRAALAIRDGGCVIPGCAVPATGCRAHHVVHWSRGGPTDLANLALLCDRHHDTVHSGVWDLEMIHALPWARPPDWIDPHRRLLRNPVQHAHQQADHLADHLRLPFDLPNATTDPDPPDEAAA
jgi:hypothetical protein